MEYPRLGALITEDGTAFRVLAPEASDVEIVFQRDRPSILLKPEGSGYHAVEGTDAPAGTLYRLRVDEGPLLPDPASRFQPDGVHGASMVVDPGDYAWGDDEWAGVEQANLVFYELHVGTFTSEGTFDGVLRLLRYLRDLGITALELMPVADFPGRRGWGYDPAALFAPSRAYGSPNALRRLVDEAHGVGLAVFLDVIYNHLGPDGAYVAAIAPMFTERHHTPWGKAINLDDKGSVGVRSLLIDNALHWLREYHFDGLRLDATHALIDASKQHFLAELAEAVERIDGPRRYLVAEDPRNINRIVLPRAQGGYGMDAVWTDDFHHQVRNMTAGDIDGYYADYASSSAHELARSIEQGWYFDGRRSPTTGKPRGTDPSGISLYQCVICIQNHDQVGNRPLGNRLTEDIDLATYRAATALLLFSPELPLLFMGQEWAASSPFQFFSDHNEELGRLVTEGRRKEFESFPGFEGQVPDPQDAATFEASRLQWHEVERETHALTLNLYRDLLRARRDLDALTAVVALSDSSVSVTRGRRKLLCALRPDIVRLPVDAEIVLHTEQEVYASDPHPPEVEAGHVRFLRPGAMILRLPATMRNRSDGA